MSDDRLDEGTELVDALRAFGLTLADTVDEPIRPPAPPSEPSEPSEDRGLRGHRALWLVAAARARGAAWDGLGRLWPSRTGSVDSTGTTTTVDDPGDPATEQGLPTTDTTVSPAEPSTITAIDGTVLAVTDDRERLREVPPRPGELDPVVELPPMRGQEDVVARAVVDELLRLRVFGQDSRDEVVDRLVSGGITIATAYDPTAEAAATAAIDELYPAGDRPDEAALVTIDNRTGAIVALASTGSPSLVLTEGLRQPGSAFKPMVLAALFEAGNHPDDLVSGDGPCHFADPGAGPSGRYTVGGSERGVRTVRSMTLSSNNCAFVRLGQAVGTDRVLDAARSLGLTTLPDEAAAYTSLPLGVTEVNGVELAGAYATFANGGVHRTPWLVASVTDRDGRVLFEQVTGDGRQVVSERTATLITSVLEDNLVSGTGVNAQLGDGRPAAGKTGTTDGFIDAWFVGFTDRYTTAVWIGATGPSGQRLQLPGWNSFGGGLPAAIWGRYNDELNRGLEPTPFPEAPPLEGRDPELLVAENEIPEG